MAVQRRGAPKSSSSAALYFADPPMPSRYVNRWTTWLLPLIVLRAFVPTGFMLSAEGGRLAPTLCPGVTARASPAATQHTEHHHGQAVHAHDAARDDPAGAEQHEGRALPCLYALTAAVCSVDAPHFVGAFARASTSKVTPASTFISRSVLRTDRIRGPPTRA